jgi:hypothetical protein
MHTSQYLKANRVHFTTMTSVTLLHPEETFTIPALQAMTKCHLFQSNPTVLGSPYRVHSPVSLSIFREFLSALEGNSITLTDTNFPALLQLSEEFLFSELSTQLSQFKHSSAERQIKHQLSEIGKVFLSESFLFLVNESVIESNVAESAALFPAVQEQLSVDSCARKFFVKDDGIESAAIDSLLSGERISNERSQLLLNKLLGNVNLERLFLNSSNSKVQMNLSESVIDLESVDLSILSVEALDNLLLNEFVTVESEDSLLRMILKLGPEYRDLLRHIEIVFLSGDGFSVLDEDFGVPPESIWESASEQIVHPFPPFDSQIISEFPEIFAEFRRKRKSLLWRGSRDGFGAFEFHRRCDGHANTLTVILDTKGNIFGGFTPVEWESRVWDGKYDDESNCWKAYDSLKSFLFTLKNPNDIPARRFELNPKHKHRAISLRSDGGPRFCDIGVADDCDISTQNNVFFGFTYINDTGLNGNIVFTGSDRFRVKEIEVFEITE